MGHYFDPEGNPLSLMEWAALFEARDCDDGPESWWRKLTKVEDVTVCTVWMGLALDFHGGPPLIYETMIFGGTLDQETYHYATKSEAWDDHERLVAIVRLDQAVNIESE